MHHVTHVLARLNVGGPAFLLSQLLTHLDPASYSLRLLVGDVDRDEADWNALRTPVPGQRIAGLGRSVRPLQELRALPQLHRRLRRPRTDLVHTHTAKAGVLGRLSSLSAGVPVRVHTFHGHLLDGYFRPLTGRAVTGAEALLARRTDRIVAVGERVRDDLLAAGIGRPEQYRVIPPGVSLAPAPTRAAARLALDVAPDASVVAVVGRLAGIKRVDRAMAVAARLPHAQFLVVGAGPLYEPLRATAPPNVRFLGWRGDVETVWAAADAGLLTSDNEGMPISLIEAGLSSVACVTTHVGSAGEVVLHERTGLVVPPHVEQLAAAVEQLLADDTRRAQLGAAARAHATTAFGTQQMVAAHDALYRELLD